MRVWLRNSPQPAAFQGSMSRRWPTLALVLLSACCAGVAPVASATAQERRDVCASPASATLANSQSVRVFIKRRHAPARVRGNTYICDRRAGHKTLVAGTAARRGAFILASRFRINGRLVAYAEERLRVDDLSRTSVPRRRILVRDARSGSVVRALDAAAVRGCAFCEPEPDDGVHDLELTRAGDLAWIVQNPVAVAPPKPNVNTSSRSVEVYVAPAGHAPQSVDLGDDIRPTMRRRGCFVSWLHGAAVRIARICTPAT